MSSLSPELKLRVSKEIELIKQNSSESCNVFKKYLENSELTKQAINFLFKEGSEAKQKIYINTVYPSPIRPEFKKYQTRVMRLGDRKTLATYYMYYEVSDNGEIELIKREDVNAFVYYITNHGLSERAFKFLIKQGAPELIEAYISNQDIDNELMPFFIEKAEVQDLQWYFLTCSTEQKEVFIDYLRKYATPETISALCEENEMLSLLFCLPITEED